MAVTAAHWTLNGASKNETIQRRGGHAYRRHYADPDRWRHPLFGNHQALRSPIGPVMSAPVRQPEFVASLRRPPEPRLAGLGRVSVLRGQWLLPSSRQGVRHCHTDVPGRKVQGLQRQLRRWPSPRSPRQRHIVIRRTHPRDHRRHHRGRTSTPWTWPESQAVCKNFEPEACAGTGGTPSLPRT